LLVVVLLAAVVGTILIVYASDVRSARERIARGSTVIQTPQGLLEYAERGEGLPVIVLHGAGGGYDQGLLVVELLLGDGYRIIAPSRFGYLGTPIPEDNSLEAQADALVSLLDHLAVERVAVVAVSAGGPAALYFSLRHPERTAGLVMAMAISYTIPPKEEDLKKLAVIHRLIGSDFIYWTMLKTARKTMLNLLGVPPETLAALSDSEQAWVNEVLFSMLPMSLRLPGIQLDEERQLPSDLPYSQITAPTLVLHARDDTLVPIAQGMNTSAVIPGAASVIFETGGHFLLGETVAIRGQITTFLEQATW
jgi:2-hydroxy-6-oxonona-2,4-dienedioate hydrolase